jgi:NAD(P)-dependent dehydrogenase (short-subunit alcohol dehydrogenase family)
MTHPLFDLSGRVGLVSGAASGMGKQISIALAEVGADVMLADINLDGAEDTAEEIRALGRKAVPILCDMSKPEQIVAMFGRLDDEFGQIDILANVAGIGLTGAPENVDISVIQQTLNNLVIGRFTACQEAGRRMLARGKGSIISIGSIAGWNSLGRSHAPYGMAMGAVIAMTRELSTEWAARGVRVNCILPAQITNAGLEARMEATPGVRDTFIGGIPMGRMGRPEEIKGVAIFLASDAASFVTGAILPMDGGNLAMNAGGTYPGGPRISG